MMDMFKAIDFMASVKLSNEPNFLLVNNFINIIVKVTFTISVFTNIMYSHNNTYFQSPPLWSSNYY